MCMHGASEGASRRMRVGLDDVVHANAIQEQSALNCSFADRENLHQEAKDEGSGADVALPIYAVLDKFPRAVGHDAAG